MKNVVSNRSMGRLSVVILVVMMVCFVFSSCRSTGSWSQDEVDAVIVRASVLVDGGDVERALAVYEDAVKRIGQDHRLLYNMGVLYAQAGNFSRALELLDLLNTLTEQANTRYLKAQGGVAAASGSYDEAISTWLHVLSLDPLEVDIRSRVVEVLMERQRFEEAYQVAMETYALRLFSKQLFEQLAVLEDKTGRGDGSSWETIASTLPEEK